MRLEFDQMRLLELMKSFHELTGFRIVLFDEECEMVFAYPQRECSFCSYMKHNPETAVFCQQSDVMSFSESRRTKRLMLYHCYAGLIEATVPLVENHVVIGYLMFGQISDAPTDRDLYKDIQKILKKFPIEGVTAADLGKEIPRKTEREIHSAAKILEACTFYVIYDEIVMLRRQNFADNLSSYIRDHIRENLTADVIAASLGISRSKLYTACDKYLGIGIAEYIRDIRIDYAKELLKNTTAPIASIADQVGFADYNYFCRVFKRKVGNSPRAYRML